MPLQAGLDDWYQVKLVPIQMQDSRRRLSGRVADHPAERLLWQQQTQHFRGNDRNRKRWCRPRSLAFFTPYMPNSRRLVVLVNVPPTHPPSIARGVAHPPYVNPKRLQHRCKRSGRHRRRRGHLRTQASNLAGTTSFSSLIDSRLRLGNKVMSRAWFRM